MNKGLDFRQVEILHAEWILKWRTSDYVTKFMKTDIDFNLENQKEWIRSLEKKNYFAWIIYLNDNPIGFINLDDLCFSNRTASWGFYIGDENFLGYGGLILPYFYNFVFNDLGLFKLKAEIFYNNLNVINMHLKFGYEFEPSLDNVIIKNGKPILLVGMTLENTNWNFKKYRNFTSNLRLKL